MFFFYVYRAFERINGRARSKCFLVECTQFWTYTNTIILSRDLNFWQRQPNRFQFSDRWTRTTSFTLSIPTDEGGRTGGGGGEIAKDTDRWTDTQTSMYSRSGREIARDSICWLKKIKRKSIPIIFHFQWSVVHVHTCMNSPSHVRITYKMTAELPPLKVL